MSKALLGKRKAKSIIHEPSDQSKRPRLDTDLLQDSDSKVRPLAYKCNYLTSSCINITPKEKYLNPDEYKTLKECREKCKSGLSRDTLAQVSAFLDPDDIKLVNSTSRQVITTHPGTTSFREQLYNYRYTQDFIDYPGSIKSRYDLYVFDNLEQLFKINFGSKEQHQILVSILQNIYDNKFDPLDIDDVEYLGPFRYKTFDLFTKNIMQYSTDKLLTILKENRFIQELPNLEFHVINAFDSYFNSLPKDDRKIILDSLLQEKQEEQKSLKDASYSKIEKLLHDYIAANQRFEMEYYYDNYDESTDPSWFQIILNKLFQVSQDFKVSDLNSNLVQTIRDFGAYFNTLPKSKQERILNELIESRNYQKQNKKDIIYRMAMAKKR